MVDEYDDRKISLPWKISWRITFSGVLCGSEVMAGELNESVMEDLGDFEATHFLLLEAQQQGPCKLSAALIPARSEGR